MLDAEVQWARETFAHAELGDVRRTRRLVKLAVAAARSPGGTIPSVESTTAGKEGAFRLLENAEVDPVAIGSAVHVATARRCRDHAQVFVALDQSSLAFVDHHNVRGLGRIGHSRRTRGLQVMTALAVDPEGITLGTCAMRWFSRSMEPTPWGDNDPRPVEDRESGLWLDAIDDVAKLFSKHAPHTKPWFQLDRGGDFWRVFDLAREHRVDITVRSNHDRVVATEKGRGRLEEALSNTKVLGRMEFFRRGRRVRLTVRARPLTMMMADEGRPRRAFALWVVRVREVGRPRGRERVSWTLLTTHRVASLADAQRVVQGYTMRWRVEEFHRTWKRGHCQVERSQLRSPEALQRWATILAAVATRIERLKGLRDRDDLDATIELTQDEIDAAILLSGTKRWKFGASLTIHEAVHLVAQVGGYMGKANGPPGATTIGRGLDKIAPAAAMARRLRRTSG